MYSQLTVLILVPTILASVSVDPRLDGESVSAVAPSDVKPNSSSESTSITTEEFESNSSDQAISAAESVVHNMDLFLVDVHKAVYLLRELGIQATLGAAMTHMLNSYVDLIQLSMKHLVEIHLAEQAADEALGLISVEIQRITSPGFKLTSGGSGVQEMASNMHTGRSTEHHKGTTLNSSTSVESSESSNGDENVSGTSVGPVSSFKSTRVTTTSHHSSTGDASESKASSGLSSLVARAVSGGKAKAKSLDLNIDINKTTHESSDAAVHHDLAQTSSHMSTFGNSDNQINGGSGYSSQSGSYNQASTYAQPTYVQPEYASQSPSGYYSQSGEVAAGSTAEQGYVADANHGYASGISTSHQYSSASTVASTPKKTVTTYSISASVK